MLVIYAAPLAIILMIYLGLRKISEQKSSATFSAAVETGMTEPASLHPKIDPGLCLGCAACARVCPEGDILGIINGKAKLVEPSHCIGHGACKEACPTNAITLVFGTEKRGVDIPLVSPTFETNVPGIFIAGELGGMGLVRNAIEQGRQAMKSITKLGGLGRNDRLDVVIVGAGPAGISASLAAIEAKLKFVTLDQDSFGGTVSHFPRGKLVMTQPATLPIIGKVNFREIKKEKLLEFWQNTARKTGLEIRHAERVKAVTVQGDRFVVESTKGQYPTRSVLLAIGRRGSPRRLNVPGEDLPKVVYRLIDPEQYRGQRVLVVGGGDSALEAACSIAEEDGTSVTLSYRSDSFSRAKLKNRDRVSAAEQAGNMTVLLKSNVQQIDPDSVGIEHEGKEFVIGNDAVIICAGGILPTGFLKSIGIEVETKHGTV